VSSTGANVDLDLSIIDVAGPSQHGGMEPHVRQEAHIGVLQTTGMYGDPSTQSGHLATQLCDFVSVVFVVT
jgi:hypothetical protein